jgi:hypothetical protein
MQKNMNKTAMKLLIPLASAVSLGINAQTHVHGQGSLFIAQDNNAWQLQFTLPAADVFGFEYAPETEEQIKHVIKQKHLLSKVGNVINVPSECTVSSHNVEIPDGFELAHAHGQQEHEHDEHEHDHDKHKHDDDHGHDHDEHKHDDDHGHDHDEHKHDHDKHEHDHDEHEHDHDKHKHDHDEHEHSDEEKHNHSDVEILVEMTCSASFNALDVPLFSSFPSVQSLEALWATDGGQGQTELSPQNTRVSF